MPTGTGGYPAVPTGTGGYPAAPTGTGGYPAAPTGTGAYPAVPTGTGAYPAVPTGTGGYPAVPTGTGGYPAVPTGTGGYPATQVRSPSGRYPTAPPPGAPTAVRPSRRYASPSGQPQASPSGTDKVPSGLDLVAPVGQAAAKRGAEGESFGRFPHIGECFDGYELVELLGQGNMGKIYRARDSMNRSLAMKVILKEVANDEGLARFQREGEALAAIPWHKNVVQVHSTGTIHGMPYLTMDFVKGQSLEDFLRVGPLPLKQAGIVAEKLAKALQHVHDAGVMHRDLKPANILIRDDNGEPVLTDFGLAGMSGAQSLTQTGDLLGTPLYMAPEQVLGLNKNVDERADVWGLGVLLYEMVAGTVPFPGTAMVEVCNAITSQAPLPIMELCPEADAALAAIINRALTKEREDRYQTPGELAADLKAWRRARKAGTPPPPPPPPAPSGAKRLLFATGALAVVGVALGAVAIVKSSRARRASGPTPEQAGEASAPQQVKERTAGERALAEARVAVQSGDLERAGDVLARVLSLPQLQREAKSCPDVAALRREAIAKGLELTRKTEVELRPKQLRPVLRLLGFLNQLSDEPAGQELANAVLARATEADKDGVERLSQRTVEFAQGLARSRAQPSLPAATAVLTEYRYYGNTRDGTDFSIRYYRLLLAMVRMDVPLEQDHLRALNWGDWKERPTDSAQDPRESFLRLMLRYLHASRADGQRREQARIFKEVRQLCQDTTAETLGPCNRAAVLMFVVHFGERWTDDPEALLKEAVEIAPGYVELRLFVAERRLKQAKQRMAKSELEAARQLVKEGQEHAASGLATIKAAGYDASIALSELCFSMRKVAVRLHTLAGDDSAARTIIEGFPESEISNRSAQLEELRRLRDEAKFHRLPLLAGGAPPK